MLTRAPFAVLDVTLRDGGYLNDWAFSADAMHAVVTALEAAGADGAEVGYIDDTPGLPLGAACPPDLLAQLRDAAPHLWLAAMLRPSVADPAAILASRSAYLDLIRIPTHANATGPSRAVAEHVRGAGLLCSINLTNVSAYPVELLAAATAEFARHDLMDVLYLADSRGALRPGEAAPLVRALRRVWDGPIGFHAHDNLGWALAHTVEALGAGCVLADGSLNGLGLGGGNTVTQDLLPLDDASADRLREVGTRVLHPLSDSQRRPYVLSAHKNISQDWIAPLVQAYPATLCALLETLPRRSYRSQDEVEAAFQTAAVPS
ncbi:MAG: pyruvate carboxyltransferase [Bacteroidota bacterium]